MTERMPCMHCGQMFEYAFHSLEAISIDGNKNIYYLCEKCNKEWSDKRSIELWGIYDGYHNGKLPYSVYQDAFNQLMKEWLISTPEKVLLN